MGRGSQNVKIIGYHRFRRPTWKGGLINMSKTYDFQIKFIEINENIGANIEMEKRKQIS